MASRTSPFDLYFHHHSKSARSSDTLFSLTSHPLTLPLPTFPRPKHALERAKLADDSRALFPHWLTELLEGFNLLFYGFGSKRVLVNEFAQGWCATEGHVVVVNGYLPHVGPADILASIEQVPGVLDEPLEGSGAEARADRVARFFSPSQEDEEPGEKLFLVVHNIDAPQLRAPRALRILSTLASARNVHLVATVDHINSALLFPRDQALGRKSHLGALSDIPVPTLKEEDGRGGQDKPSSIHEPRTLPQRGLKSWSWLWHDLTTFEPYTAELAHRDLTVPPSVGTSTATAATTAATTEVTPSAAQHVFASVTTKAQKVFSMLGTRQLRALEEGGVVRVPSSGMAKYAVPYDVLLAEARDEFVAANDAALRGLLGEFRDHGMIVSGEAEAGGEVLWVPASQDVLKAILGYLSK